MPEALVPLLAVIAAYLLGSISFAVVTSRLFGLADPRSYGSKNPGATNVLRSGHKAAALLTLLGDALKGTLAVLLAKAYAMHFAFGDGTVALVAIAVFTGHLFPIFLRFKGGKGVATAAGVLLALHLGVGLTALALWILTAAAFRFSSLAALVAAAGAPIAAGMVWGINPLVGAIALMSAALIGKHWPNLERLMAGTEPKIGGGKAHAGKAGARRKA